MNKSFKLFLIPHHSLYSIKAFLALTDYNPTLFIYLFTIFFFIHLMVSLSIIDASATFAPQLAMVLIQEHLLPLSTPLTLLSKHPIN